MTKRIKRPAGLSGADGLALAIIHQATADAIKADPDTMRDAWAYLGSDWYRLNADALGLPGDIMPVLIEQMAHDELLRISECILGSD